MYSTILMYVFYIVKTSNLNHNVCNLADNEGSDHASLCKTGNTFLHSCHIGIARLRERGNDVIR